MVRQGRLDFYESEATSRLLFSLPLLQCRIEKSQFLDASEQKGCDFEFGVRVVAGEGFRRQVRDRQRETETGLVNE